MMCIHYYKLYSVEWHSIACTVYTCTDRFGLIKHAIVEEWGSKGHLHEMKQGLQEPNFAKFTSGYLSLICVINIATF